MSGAGQGPTASLVDAIAAADSQLDGPVAATATVARQGGRNAAPGHRYVLLSIASAHYAVREAFVTELERVPKITLVPHVPAWVRGVTNLRGDILSVIDMRTFLGLDSSPSHSARMLVVRLLHEEFATGLLVDGVDRIVAILDLDRLLRSSAIRQFEEHTDETGDVEAGSLALTTTDRDGAEGAL